MHAWQRPPPPRKPMSAREKAWTAVVVALIALVPVVDHFLPPDIHIAHALVLPVSLAAVFFGPRRAALTAGLAVLALVAAGAERSTLTSETSSWSWAASSCCRWCWSLSARCWSGAATSWRACAGCPRPSCAPCRRRPGRYPSPPPTAPPTTARMSAATLRRGPHRGLHTAAHRRRPRQGTGVGRRHRARPGRLPRGGAPAVAAARAGRVTGGQRPLGNERAR